LDVCIWIWPEFQGQEMKINLGVNLSFVGTRFTEPEEWTKIVAEELKLKYIQFFSDILDPIFSPPEVREKTCQKIKKLCSKYGLIIHSNFSGTIPHCLNLLFHPDEEMRKVAVRWFENGIEDTIRMGSRGYGSFLGALTRRSLRDLDKKSFLIKETLKVWKHLSRVGKKKGLEFMLFEPMSCAREIPSTIEETKWWYEKLNQVSELPVHILVDVGHGNVHSGNEKDGNPYAWLEELGDKILVIHLQQTNRSSSKHWPFIPAYNEKGIIKPEKIVSTLSRSRGEGEVFFFLEVNYPPFEPMDNLILDHLKSSVIYWKNILKVIKNE